MMKQIRQIIAGKWFKFGLVALCYSLWVLWLGNYWWLFGVVIVFDLYVTRKVKWAFWKKKYKAGEKHNVWLDWIDAIVFALIAATFIRMYFYEAYVIPTSSMESSLMTGDYLFVSKSYYGPRIPETPLSLPLVHNTTPVLNTPSYVEWLKWDYRRMPGRSKVKAGDIVVFGFPHGDTVLKQEPMQDYYTIARLNGRAQTIHRYGPVIVRPVDKKDNYVKRCIAVAGDTVEVRDGRVWRNGQAERSRKGVQYSYIVKTNGTPVNAKILDKMGVNTHEAEYDSRLPGYTRIFLSDENAEKIRALPNVVGAAQSNDVYPPDYPDMQGLIFPFADNYLWTRDNFGPLWIPAKGATVALTLENLPLYERIIGVYEHNDLRVADSVIYINGAAATGYTFKMDYYFMMGDNRHNSLDSRYWGFVPEDHVVGAPAMVWFSTDQHKPFPTNIRWKRLFNLL
ncbi:MAG: signal peptidase I [Prevotellaceae bacterium]|jgi:signal peptidase I|nr:signal peptidase I [Prevotellaceae bacterium]